MLVVKQAPDARARITIPLGRGASAIARKLDVFEQRMIGAEARAEFNTLIAGEETKRPWASISPQILAEARADEAAGEALRQWMYSVLHVTACVEALDGLDQADGFDDAGEPINRRPMTPSFEAFELLLIDGEVEVAFRVGMLGVDRLWAEEKNVSASALNGSGAEALNSAQGAKTPETPAPEAENEPSPMDPEALAPSAPMPAEPPKASSPGSLAAAAPGDSPAAAD